MFSVIISTYNRPWFLRRSISSVLEQTHHPSEILIIDSGTKPVYSLVDSYKDKTPIKIRYVREELPNVCLMRNLGAKKAPLVRIRVPLQNYMFGQTAENFRHG